MLGDALPASHDGFDALVMLGGAQDALDDANHPYLTDEAALARAFGEADKAVLGICLGAQLVARALRRREHPRPADRVRLARGAPDGSRPRRSGARRRSASGAPLFHWHVDTFTLPPGAVHLADERHDADAGFSHRPRVYGIQFHFEAGTELVESWNARLRRRDRATTRPTGRSGTRRRRRSTARRPTPPGWRWRAPGSALHRAALVKPAGAG